MTKVIVGRWLLCSLLIIWALEGSASPCDQLLRPGLLQSEFSGLSPIAKHEQQLHVEFDAKPALNTEALESTIAETASYRLPNRAFAHSHPEKAHVQIVKLGHQHTYVAVFNHSVYMNWALARIAFYLNENRILSGRGLTQINSQAQGLAGYNINADLFRNFKAAFLKGAVNDSVDSAKLQVEWEFWRDVILPLLKQDPDLNLIAVSLDYKPRQTLSHEILHAHFYEIPELQHALLAFWQSEVTPTDQALYLVGLKRENYNINNRLEVVNEFFAYTLEDEIANTFSRSLILRYRERLRHYLKQAGFTQI